jgi:hypothetical protein
LNFQLGIPSICILGHILAAAKSRDINSIKQHISGIGHEVVPLRRIAKLERTNGATLQSDDTHQNGTQDESILCIQIIPDLTISIEGTIAIHIDILAAELEEGRGVLVDLLESICLPVIGVIGELNMALDFYLAFCQSGPIKYKL